MNVSRQSKVSVLIVDDEEPICAALKRCLVRQDCEVQTAHTLAGARELFARSRFDIAFVDFNLPDGTAPSLIRWALAEKRTHAIYCITASQDVRSIVSVMQAGATNVLEKPIDLHQVATIVEARRNADSGDLDAWRRQFAP